jgi:hypothetical protein
MTREIANSGYGLTDNGIVAADSGLTSIRRARKYERRLIGNDQRARPATATKILSTCSIRSRTIITSCDSTLTSAASEMVLANRVDALKFRYYADKVTYETSDCDITNVRDSYGNPAGEVALKGGAKYVVQSICVNLPAVSAPGAPGYQPSSSLQLVSDIALRNSALYDY